jgi:hypothetical protein
VHGSREAALKFERHFLPRVVVSDIPSVEMDRSRDQNHGLQGT